MNLAILVFLLAAACVSRATASVVTSDRKLSVADAWFLMLSNSRSGKRNLMHQIMRVLVVEWYTSCRSLTAEEITARIVDVTGKLWCPKNSGEVASALKKLRAYFLVKDLNPGWSPNNRHDLLEYYIDYEQAKAYDHAVYGMYKPSGRVQTYLAGGLPAIKDSDEGLEPIRTLDVRRCTVFCSNCGQYAAFDAEQIVEVLQIPSRVFCPECGDCVIRPFVELSAIKRNGFLDIDPARSFLSTTRTRAEYEATEQFQGEIQRAKRMWGITLSAASSGLTHCSSNTATTVIAEEE